MASLTSSRVLQTLIIAIIFIVAMVAHERTIANDSFFLSEAGWWLIAAGVIAYVMIVEKRPLKTIGVKAVSISTLVTAAIGLTGAVFLVGVSGVIAPLIGLNFSNTQDAMQSASSVPLWALALTVLRAGIVEELFFRGFLLSRFLEFKWNPVLAVVLTTVLFVAPHALFWGGAHLILVAIASLVFSTMFVLRRDLLACILAHIGFNAGGLIASQFA